MPLEGFELLAVFEANDVLGCHRFLHRYRGFQFDFLRLNALDRGPAQSAIDRADEIRKLVAGKRIMSDVRRYDIGMNEVRSSSLFSIFLHQTFIERTNQDTENYTQRISVIMTCAHKSSRCLCIYP